MFFGDFCETEHSLRTKKASFFFREHSGLLYRTNSGAGTSFPMRLCSNLTGAAAHSLGQQQVVPLDHKP